MSIPGLIVRKVGMTRMVDPDGKMVPVTLLQAEKQKITKILTAERDGYDGVQIGYRVKREKLLTKPDVHRLRKSQIEENFTSFREFRLEKPDAELQLGAELTVTGLGPIAQVDICGFTKGRGFQGAIKRWGSCMGRQTHGSNYHRRTGSIGSNTSPARVFKNKKMPGRMGNAARTIQNLTVIDVDKGQNLIVLKGSVPGHRDGFLILKPTVKKIKQHKQASEASE